MSSRTKASQGTILETHFRTHSIKIVLEKDGSVNVYPLHIGALRTSQQGKRGMSRDVSTISGMVAADMMTPMNMNQIPVT
jgi:hypothetical protein